MGDSYLPREDWNPLKDDYDNELINSYDRGPGASLPRNQQPANIRKGESGNVKLYLYPLNPDYTKVSLENIFRKFGEVVDVYIDPKAGRWSFVTLKSQAAAEKALRELNDDPIFKFKVKYANDKEKKNPSAAAAADSASTSSFGMNNRKNDEKQISGSQFIKNFKDQNLIRRSSHESAKSDSPSVQSDRSLMSFKFSETLFPSNKNTNVVENIKKKTVMNGDPTGYFSIPNCFGCKRQTLETCTKCNQPFCSVKCMILGYEGHTDSCVQVAPHSKSILSTVNSRNLVDYSHPISREFANSSADYLNNLPNYKPIERPHSTVSNSYVDEDVFHENNCNDSVTQAKIEKRSVHIKKSDVRKSVYNDSTKQNDDSRKSDMIKKNEQFYEDTSAKNITEVDDSCIKFNPRSSGSNTHQRDRQINDRNVSLPESNDDNRYRKSGSNASFKTSSSEGKEFNQEEWKNNASKNYAQTNKYSRVDENTYKIRAFRHLDRVCFEPGVEYKVKLTSTRPPTIRILKESRSLEMFMEDIQTLSYEPIKEDVYGGLRCIVKHDDQWCRGLVAGINPFQVRLIDNNYDAIPCRREDLRQLPSELNFIYPFAYKVQFRNVGMNELDELNDTIFEIIAVERIHEKKLWSVEKVKKPFEEKLKEARSVRDAEIPVDLSERSENHQESPSQVSSFNRETESTNTLPDFNFTLEKNVPIKVTVSEINEKLGITYVTIYPNINLLQKKIAELNISSLSAVKDIRMNTMCLALYENDWYRARIVSVDPLRVFFVDFGNTEEVFKNNLKILPSEFFNIIPLAVAVKFRNGSKSRLDFNDMVDIIPVEEDSSDKTWIIRLPSEPDSMLESDVPDRGSNPLVHSDIPSTSEKSVNLSPLPKSESPKVLPEFKTLSLKLETTSSEDGPKFSENESLNVQVTYRVSSTEYFVGKLENASVIQIVSSTDEDEFKKNPVKSVTEGLLCAKFYDGFWSRTKVICTNPLTVYYLDFGNNEEASLNELYHLPENLKNIPPLAFRIHFEKPVSLEEYGNYYITKKSGKFWDLVNKPIKVEIGSNMDVMVLAAFEDSYGVIPRRSNDDFEEIQKSLIKMGDHLPELENPKIGQVCAEKSNVLARVKIIETSPLIINYIDFGYEEWKTSASFREIPEYLAKIEPLGFKITVENTTFPLKEGDSIKIEILDMVLANHYFVRILDVENDSEEENSEIETEESDDGKVISDHENLLKVVEYSPNIEDCSENQILPNEPARRKEETVFFEKVEKEDFKSFREIGEKFQTRYPPIPNKNFIESVKCNTVLGFTVMNRLSDSLYTGIIMKSQSPHIGSLSSYLKTLSTDPNYKPRTGDFIAALLPNSDVWCRAIVLNEPSNVNFKYKVAMFDVGCVFDVEEICPLSEYFQSLGNLSVYCQILNFPPNEKPLEKFETYPFETDVFDCGAMKTLISTTSTSKSSDYSVQFKPWKPTIDEMGIQTMSLQNGSRVKISAYNVSNMCFLCLSDEKSLEIEMSVLEDVAYYCLEEAFPLSRDPLKDEIVGVNYEDTFYRGKVLGQEGEKCSIMILDRGIECTSLKDDLKELPEYLKLPYCIAIPVKLKNVPITEICPKVANYLKNVIAREKKFDVIIDSLSGETELKFVDDESHTNGKTLNEYLSSLYTPDWKKKLNDPQLIFDDFSSEDKFFYYDMQFDDLPVGSEVNLYVTAVRNDMLVAVNKNGKNYKKQLDVNLSKRMAEYANTITDSYVPVVNELCIAKHEDTWYRALCMESYSNQKLTLQLIDHGPVVYIWHTDIRKMISEFYQYVATAIICNIKDAEKYGEKMEQLIETELQGVKILEFCSPGEYLVDLENVLL